MYFIIHCTCTCISSHCTCTCDSSHSAFYCTCTCISSYSTFYYTCSITCVLTCSMKSCYLVLHQMKFVLKPKSLNYPKNMVDLRLRVRSVTIVTQGFIN